MELLACQTTKAQPNVILKILSLSTPKMAQRLIISSMAKKQTTVTTLGSTITKKAKTSCAWSLKQMSLTNALVIKGNMV